MLEVTRTLRIPRTEFHFTFVRASGPGGQNVNKVSSKAVLRWNVHASPSLPPAVKARLLAQQRRRITADGDLILTAQRYRDQGRNIDDCFDKVRALILQAVVVPKPRKPTKPSRGSQERRLQQKRLRSASKVGRRRPAED